jgi:hypothetical protein
MGYTEEILNHFQTHSSSSFGGDLQFKKILKTTKCLHLVGLEDHLNQVPHIFKNKYRLMTLPGGQLSA